ncbi:hypothetical protein [Pseudomonas sp. DC3000-4b1]|uniref:hypothetical protein n=1 Tax=unclassified Pseudomonas TaxID=196821 RepID=UPI003CF9EEBA
MKKRGSISAAGPIVPDWVNAPAYRRGRTFPKQVIDVDSAQRCAEQPRLARQSRHPLNGSGPTGYDRAWRALETPGKLSPLLSGRCLGSPGARNGLGLIVTIDTLDCTRASGLVSIGLREALNFTPASLKFPATFLSVINL